MTLCLVGMMVSIAMFGTQFIWFHVLTVCNVGTMAKYNPIRGIKWCVSNIRKARSCSEDHRAKDSSLAR
jgi:hypothetical protein